MDATNETAVNATSQKKSITKLRSLVKLSGNVTKEEREAIQIINRGLVPVNNTYYPIVDLNMIPGPYSEEKQLEMGW